MKVTRKWYQVVNPFIDKPFDTANTEIVFGEDYEYGISRTGKIRWYSIDGESLPKLEIFNDAWPMLNRNSSLLVNNPLEANEDDICRKLEQLGFLRIGPTMTEG
jgi:hypothetical protein